MRKQLGLVTMLLAIASHARAGNDDGILLGNDAALVGGAVVSTVDDGSALWYNPAGLADAKQNSVDVSANGFALRRYKLPNLISADGGSGGNANFTELLVIPSAVTYARQITKNLVGGVGVFVSQVDDFTLRATLGLPLGDDQADIKLLITQQSARYSFSAGLGGKLGQHVRFGGSLFVDYDTQSGLSQASTQIDSPTATVASDVNSVFAQDKLFGLHMRYGVIWDALAGLRLGASVQTGARYVYLSDRTSSIESTTAPGADGTTPMLSATHSDVTASKYDFARYAPWRFRVGGSYALPSGGTLSLEGDVQTPVKDVAAQTDRVFVWNVRAGARFPISERFRVGAGLFTDRGAERKDAMGAGNADFYGVTLGAQYDSVHWLSIDGSDPSKPPSRSPLTFSTTLALRYAYGVGKLAGQKLTAPDFDAVENAVKIGVHEVTVHLGSGVYF